MKLQGIKTTMKRRSESPRAKRQQQGRRRESLFKKACEYSAECDAEVYLCVKIKGNGQIFSFNSENSREWLLSDEQMVGHSLSKPC
jgi:SRF-type transcription factor (DNA-binding and dimerisation domain)